MGNLTDAVQEAYEIDAKDAARRAAHLVLIWMDDDLDRAEVELQKLATGDDADPEFVALVAGMAARVAALLAKQYPGEFIRDVLNGVIAENATFRLDDLGNAP